MKKLIFALFFILTTSTIYAADYDYIDTGEYYYTNNWGENDYVQVVKKLGNQEVKVRDVYSGETKVVLASNLLTKSELETEETVNGVGGVAVGIGLIYCIANPDECGLAK